MAAWFKIVAEGHLLIKLLIDDFDRGCLNLPRLGHGAEIARRHSESTRQQAAHANKRQLKATAEDRLVADHSYA